MNNIIELISTQIVLWFALIKVKNIQYTKWIVLCPVLNVLLCTVLYFYDNFLLYAIGAIFFYIISPLIFTKNKKISTVVVTSILVIGIFLFISVIILIFLTYIKASFIDLRFCIIIGMAIMMIILYILQNKKINNYFEMLPLKIQILLMFFVWAMLILVALLSVLILEVFENKQIIFVFGFIIAVFIILAISIVFILIFSSAKNSYYSALTTELEERIAEQVRFYEQLSKSNNDLRKFRHDCMNFTIGLKAFLLNKDIDGAMEFLDNCNDIIICEKILFKTGNHIVDALLSDKSSRIDNSIHINFNGIIPNDCINPVDLCIVFGNALDNAIEACEEMPVNQTKEINITVKQKHEYLFIEFSNPTLKNIKIKNNRITTSKKDKNSHGIGLYSIDKAVKKYNGHLYIECIDNLFTLKTDLCFKKM